MIDHPIPAESMHRIASIDTQPGLYAEANEAQENADTPDDFMTVDGVMAMFARVPTAVIWAGTFAALGWIAWLMVSP